MFKPTHSLTYKRGFYGKPETRRFGSLKRAREVARLLRSRGYTVQPPRAIEATSQSITQAQFDTLRGIRDQDGWETLELTIRHEYPAALVPQLLARLADRSCLTPSDPVG